MNKGLLNAYCYQILWQLPNLVIIPLLAPFVESNSIVGITKLFFIVALIYVISDWGHSTLGAQKLVEVIGSENKLDKIFIKGESLRVINCLISMSIFYLALANGALQEGREGYQQFLSLVGIASASQLIFPNWAIVGFQWYSKVNLTLLKMRLVTLIILFGSIFSNVPIYDCFLMYYIALLLFTLAIRYKFTKVNRLSFFIFNARSFVRLKFTDFNPGLIYVLGGISSYLTLNSGVFFADYFLGKPLAASYATAERLLAAVRAVYLPFVQFTFVKISRKSSLISGQYQGKTRENLHITRSRLYISFLYAGLVLIIGEIYFYIFYVDPVALLCFRILIVGLAFLGISHHYVTFMLLGRGHRFLWISGLFAALIVYVGIVVSLVFFGLMNIFIIPGAVVVAELILLLYGFLFSIFFLRSGYK
ncbi:hypothetical protein [Limnohabitans sp. INBF002]|uniref:hypothetical protein n=1 Tax=Limnohabitans sp. INBF002 TaxID=2986280 RepID=UPI00249214B2|nr:hypothetical protein [Limnohabitans sp. INBF002]